MATYASILSSTTSSTGPEDQMASTKATKSGHTSLSLSSSRSSRSSRSPSPLTLNNVPSLRPSSSASSLASSSSASSVASSSASSVGTSVTWSAPSSPDLAPPSSYARVPASAPGNSVTKESAAPADGSCTTTVRVTPRSEQILKKENWRAGPSSNEGGQAVPTGSKRPVSSPSPARRATRQRLSRVPLQEAPQKGQVVWLPREVDQTSIFKAHQQEHFFGRGNVTNHPLVVLEVHDDKILCAQCTSFGDNFAAKDLSHNWRRRYYPLGHQGHKYKTHHTTLACGSMDKSTYVNVETPLAIEWRHCDSMPVSDDYQPQPRLDKPSYLRLHRAAVDFKRGPRTKPVKGYNDMGMREWLESNHPTWLQPIEP
ncbi:hypothetical protein B9Z65_8840 [Elsinoe australis]|uniref:Uncharacterized protein n=1 Tax=Elsinoe australis TaxID=40998 RepID=A0A2P7YEX5_9PEZI|nr:hypothetical protein B9Z65_8840 [Elsinoe australis]